jgi:hypothetical protein
VFHIVPDPEVTVSSGPSLPWNRIIIWWNSEGLLNAGEGRCLFAILMSLITTVAALSLIWGESGNFGDFYANFWEIIIYYDN